jgi:peptide/nickel transport system permease protein
MQFQQLVKMNRMPEEYSGRVKLPFRSLIALICTAFLSIILIASIIAPILAPFSYDQINLPGRLQLPSIQHWLGTDELGRDILSRLLYGGRVSFFVSFTVVILSMITGVTIGLIAGFYGGWLDEVLMRLADIFLAFPGILLAIALMAVLGPSLQNVVIALVTIGWISYARIARSLTLKLRELDFVRASVNLGAGTFRILFHHIFPNAIPTLIVQASFSFAGVILAESSLSFLGLGVQPPQPSWGTMLNEGKNHLLDAPYLTMFPGLSIFISVLSFNLLGDSLRDRLDPRFRQDNP